MVRPLDDLEGRRRPHSLAHAFEEVERAKRVAGSLNEHRWREQFQENLIAKLRPVAGAAER